jgi:serine/threonine-protein kinase
VLELDGHAVGTTPMDLAMLPPGTRRIHLRLEGHDDWERAIEVRAGERAHIVATLGVSAVPLAVAPRPAREPEARPAAREPREAPAPRAEPGQLSINTRPWSKVYLGSRLLGTTPIGGVEVESGQVRLRFVDRDGEEHTHTITVPPGGHAREFVDLRAEAGSP